MSARHLRNIHVRDLAPGLWEDAGGGVHISIPDLHAALGIEDNSPEAIRVTMTLVKEFLETEFRKRGVTNPKIILRERPDE